MLRLQLLGRQLRAAAASVQQAGMGASTLAAVQRTPHDAPEPSDLPLRTCSGASTSQPDWGWGRPAGLQRSGGAGVLDFRRQLSALAWSGRTASLQEPRLPTQLAIATSWGAGPAPIDHQQQQQQRSVFGAAKPRAANPQNHTHDKYKQSYPQPTYE